MNRAIFFGQIRRSLFRGKMTAAQVAGINAILDACERHGLEPLPLDHTAYTLASVKRETGGHMLGIKETVMPSHKDKNPSDATVIARLDRAWAEGKLGKVKAPYWRDGWFGRGPIQITHERNYIRFGKRLGVDLRARPELALDREIGAAIAVIGMVEGLFTGKKLADYTFPEAVDLPPGKNPRRIVNGRDGSDAEVAGVYRQFRAALIAAGYGEIAMGGVPADRAPPADVRGDGLPAPEPEPVEPAAKPSWFEVQVIRPLLTLLTALGLTWDQIMSADPKFLRTLAVVAVLGIALWAFTDQGRRFARKRGWLT